MIRESGVGIRIGRAVHSESRVPSHESRHPGSRARERRLVARLRTPVAVQRYLNDLPYNQEPGGRATLRSFRGVVREGLRALPGGGAVRRGRPRGARLPAARPQLRVDRRAGPRDLRLSSERPLGIGGAIARSGSARPEAGLRDAAGAGAQLLRPVRRLHRAASPATRSSTSPRRWATTTGGWRPPTCGRSSGCCSTTRIGRSDLRMPAWPDCERGTVHFGRAMAENRSTTAAGSAGRPCPRNSGIDTLARGDVHSVHRADDLRHLRRRSGAALVERERVEAPLERTGQGRMNLLTESGDWDWTIGVMDCARVQSRISITQLLKSPDYPMLIFSRGRSRASVW